MHTQWDFARYLVEDRKAHYHLIVKNNQKTLLNDISTYFQNSDRAPEFVDVTPGDHERAIVDARKNIRGLLDFSDIYSAGHIIKGVAKFDPAYLASGTGMHLLKNIIKKINDPNNIIKKMFKEAGKAISKQKQKDFRDLSGTFESGIEATPYKPKQPTIISAKGMTKKFEMGRLKKTGKGGILSANQETTSVEVPIKGKIANIPISKRGTKLIRR